MAQRLYKSYKQARFRAASMSRYNGGRYYYVKDTPMGYVVKMGKYYIRRKKQ